MFKSRKEGLLRDKLFKRHWTGGHE